MAEVPLTGPVEIIGVGLLGASLGLALRKHGIEVLLSDLNPDHVRTATGLGAGRARTADDLPELVVVAVPPSYLGQTIRRALDETDAIVTDVGSVKVAPLRAVADHRDVARYVGSHPMAGTERSGPLTATADLFVGRPWAIAPHGGSDPEAILLVESLVRLVGAVPKRFDPEDHDEAVARISHLPHLMAAVVAGGLVGAPDRHVELSGPGVRDVTRVAGGSPELYSQILTHNPEPLIELLTLARRDLAHAIDALRGGDIGAIQQLLSTGNDGVGRIPAKHGGPARTLAELWVTVQDRQGELARLFADAADLGVNIEDVRIDHEPARPVGAVHIWVEESSAAAVLDALNGRGWPAHR